MGNKKSKRLKYKTLLHHEVPLTRTIHLLKLRKLLFPTRFSKSTSDFLYTIPLFTSFQYNPSKKQVRKHNQIYKCATRLLDLLALHDLNHEDKIMLTDHQEFLLEKILSIEQINSITAEYELFVKYFDTHQTA